MRLWPEKDAFARSGEIEKTPVFNESRYRNLLIFHKAIFTILCSSIKNNGTSLDTTLDRMRDVKTPPFYFATNDLYCGFASLARFNLIRRFHLEL